MDVEVRETVDGDRLPQLMDLFASAWWTATRSESDVVRVLAASDLVFALVDRRADRLVGFARVITDEVYLAVVLDVIVAPDRRGSGLGAVLLDAIVDDLFLPLARATERT